MSFKYSLNAVLGLMFEPGTTWIQVGSITASANLFGSCFFFYYRTFSVLYWSV